MRYEDEDFTEGLQQATRGAKPARGRRWSGGGGGGWGSLKERVSAAKGSPQAVFKISSYSRSSSAVWDRVNYVARDGEIEVEMPNGEEISQQELGRLVEEWSADAEEGGRSQIAMAAVVSFPDGVDKEQATEAARQFFAEAFGKNHDYVFAAHEDAKQFHVHVVVQVAGADGKQLRIRRGDIQDLRVLLAEKAREQGIELDASPRWARGLEPEERKRQEEEGRTLRVGGGGKELHIEKNKFTNGPEHPERPVRENAGARAAREALSAERARGQQEPGGALEYARAAAALASQISQREQPQEKVAAVKGAVQLATAGWKLTEQGIGKAEDLAAARIVIDRVDKSINAQIRGLEKGRSQKAAITARRSLAGCLVEYRKAEREKGREAESRESRTADGTPAEEKTTARAGGSAEEPDKGREPESRESRTEDGTPAEEKTPEPAERPAEEPDKGREPESRESRTEDGTSAEEKTPEPAERPGEGRGWGREELSRENQALEYAAAAARLSIEVRDMESDEQKARGVRDAVALAGFAWELAAKARDRDGIVSRTREIVEKTEGMIFSVSQGIADGPAKQAADRADQELARQLVKYRAAQGTKALAAERNKSREREP